MRKKCPAPLDAIASVYDAQNRVNKQVLTEWHITGMLSMAGKKDGKHWDIIEPWLITFWYDLSSELLYIKQSSII